MNNLNNSNLVCLNKQIKILTDEAYSMINQIINILSDIDIKKYLNNQSTVFSLTISGQYGSNQSAPKYLFEKYLNNFNELTNIEKLKVEAIIKQFNDYTITHNFRFYELGMSFILANAENGGCGIAANTNIIIDYYSHLKNGEKRFEDEFNIPLYYEDENNNKYYNYEALFTQLYLANNLDDLLNIKLVPDMNPIIYSFMKSSGLTTSSVTYTLKNALQNNNNIETKTISNTNAETYKTYISNYNYCTIGAHNFTLKPLGEECINKYGDKSMTFPAGHYMTITGLTENSNFVVSSWGYQFELTDCKYGDLTFVKLEENNEHQ